MIKTNGKNSEVWCAHKTNACFLQFEQHYRLTVENKFKIVTFKKCISKSAENRIRMI